MMESCVTVKKKNHLKLKVALILCDLNLSVFLSLREQFCTVQIFWLCQSLRLYGRPRLPL